MTTDTRRLYRALAARDARFDGVFFVGVSSTGIYCRPVCPARTPRAANCRFFDAAHAAEHAGFRPCLRCRPELAPGSAPIDDGDRIARLVMERLEAGTLGEQAGLEAVAAQFELSSRQMRRIVRSTLGVPPIQLLLTRRLLLAKHLLGDTTLPVTTIAFASGFASLRRFNDAFKRRYGMPPTAVRRGVIAPGAGSDASSSVLRLSYRPPYDWDGILGFLAARAVAGVEHVTPEGYARTVRIGSASGWIRVTRGSGAHELRVEFAHSLTPVLPAVLARIRALFDLTARPDLIAKHLGRDRRLGALVRAMPGVRVPGAFDGFEIAVRAIVGQQVTVKGATTLAGRLAAAYGEPIVTPYPHLTRITVRASTLAEAPADDIAQLGVTSARARSLVALARAYAAGTLHLEPGASERTVDHLVALPGIGPWTAHYIAMRALAWPDAFPADDLVLRNALGAVSARAAEELSQAWRPWRSYAVMYLWRSTGALVPAVSPTGRTATRRGRRA